MPLFPTSTVCSDWPNGTEHCDWPNTTSHVGNVTPLRKIQLSSSEEKEDTFFICHIHNYMTSSEICALHLTHPSAHTPGAVGSWHCGTGEQLGVRWLAQGSHLSRGLFLPELIFEPTKSDTLSIRPQLPPIASYRKGNRVAWQTEWWWWWYVFAVHKP